MNRMTLSALILAWAFPLSAAAHDVPNMKHTHAFEQTGYGTYRQGHTVNSPQGSITIWSPRTYTGYQAKPPVEFARPEPVPRGPNHSSVPVKPVPEPGLEYGKKSKKDYGD